jgi:branched-chain amino acid transport system substrate-binding protein
MPAPMKLLNICQVKGSNLEDAALGCHGCHVKAENDSVFVKLSMNGTPMPMHGSISIGVIVAETGQYVEPYGASMLQGFELASDEINATATAISTPLNLVVVDDMSTLEGTVAAVEQLVAQDVPAIVGVALSTHLKEAFPIAQENGVVAFSSLSAAAGLSSIGDYVFRVGLATDRLLPAGVTATHAKVGYEKPAAIYDATDVYANSSHTEIKKALTAAGLTLVIEETFETGDTDFTAQLTRIKDHLPDALFISALSHETIRIIRQARALGIPETVAIILPDLGVVEIQNAAAAAEGVITFTGWSPYAQTPGNQAFIDNYMAKYGNPPDAWAAQSYATLYILTNAIINAQSSEASAIRDALAATMDFPSILGNFSFDPNGEAVYEPILQIVKDGELHVLE